MLLGEKSVREGPAPPHPQGFFRLRLSAQMVQRPPPQQQLKRVLAEAAVDGGRLPTKTSTTAVSACPHRGSRPAHHHRRTRTFVCLRPHLSDCHLGSSRLQPRTPAAHAFVFVHVDDAFASLREEDEDCVDGWHCRLSCADGKRATLVSHLYPAHEPPAEFLKKSTAPHPQKGPRRRPAQLAPN